MKMVKLLIISSILFLFLSCKEKNKEQEPKLISSQSKILTRKKTSELNQVKEELQTVKESGLEGKKFYFLKKDKDEQHILEIFPQYSGDFEMKKYLFKDRIFIDGGNVMEPTEWNVQKILKKDSIIKYIINLIENNKIIDTLNLIYRQKKGLIYHTVRKGYDPIILIDSSYIKSVKTEEIKYKRDDE